MGRFKGNLDKIPLVFLLIACASSAQFVITPSRPQKPDWIESVPQDSQFLFVVGAATGRPSMEEARTPAMKDGKEKIAAYIGSDVEAVFSSRQTESMVNVVSETRSKSKARVVKAEEVDSYSVTTTRIDGSHTMMRYDYYVLLRFPKSEADVEIGKLEEETRQKVRTGLNLYAQAIENEKQKSYRQARRLYGEVLAGIRDLNKTLATKDPSLQTIGELSASASLKIQEIDRLIRRTYVWIRERNLGEQTISQTMAQTLEAEVSKYGFSVADMGTASLDFDHCLSGDNGALAPLRAASVQLLIIGTVDTEYSSMYLNNHFCRAKGMIHIIDVAHGEILSALPVNVKGYHAEKARAGLDALAKAGKLLGDESVRVIDQLNSAENSSGIERSYDP